MNANWYKIAQVGEKQPWQMTQDEFVRYHITGSIQSDAYDGYKTIDGIRNVNRKEDYPILYDTKQFNDVAVEFRKSGDPLKYVKNDENDNIIRDEHGMATYLSKEEMREKKLPMEDQSIVAFVGDDPIGFASNEFGATGIWVVEDYQNMGIGSYLLKEFRKTMKPTSKMGQATSAGIALTKKYHKELVRDALQEGKPVPENVLEDYPDLMGKEYNLDYWTKKISRKPLAYYDAPDEFKYTPQIQTIMKNIYIDRLSKDPSEYYSLPKEFKESKEIQEFISKNPERY